MKGGINKPLVSVCCITYNQEKFIGEALKGFVSQKTNFIFEVIISDDCSTDGTPEVLETYAKKYPNIIKVIHNKKNKGSIKNFNDNFSLATGKYVAICEGDDYWTDPTKLQRQVDFMEVNDDYSICFHPVIVKYDDGSIKDQVFPESKDDFTLIKLLEGNFIQTNSVMYRRQKKYNLSKADFVPGDWYLHIYHARLGKIGFINRVMSVYRRHSEGMWINSNTDLSLFWKQYAIKHLEFCAQLLLLFKNDEQNQKKILLLSSRIIYEINKTNRGPNPTLMKTIMKKYPRLVLGYIEFLRVIIDEKNEKISIQPQEKVKVLINHLARRLVKNSKIKSYLKKVLRIE